MTRITKVTITVETDNGDLIQASEPDPGPQGGNPRYIQRQVDTGIIIATERVNRAIMGMYGEQYAPVRREV